MAPINPDDDNKLAPDIILGARQFPNPDGIAPRMDTEGPPPTRFTGGAKLTLADNPGGLGVSGTAAPRQMTSPTSLEDAAAAANEQEDTQVDQPQEQGINKLGSHYPSMPKPVAAAGGTEASPELGLPAVSGSGPAIAHQATMADVPKPVNNPEGQARHAEQLRQFGAAKEKANSELLRSPDEFANPLDFTRHLENTRAQIGAIKEAKAEYELSHPWGTMESAHPGFFGKLGHAFGTIGNVAGEALAPGIAAAIPGSHERLLSEKAAGEQQIGAAIKEQSESAAAGLAGKKAITEAGKPAVNEARVNELGAKQGLEEKKTDIATPKDESQAIHDLMVGNPEGGPRINPLTQKPYTYAEAYGAVKGLGKPEAKQKLQHVSGTVNGKPTMANFDPASGEYTSPDTHERLQGFQPAPNYAQVLPEKLETQTKELVGPDGIAHQYGWNPKTRAYDVDMGVSGAGQQGSRLFASGVSKTAGETLIHDIQNNKKDLGTVEAWVKKHGLDTPIAEPVLARLQSELASFAALQPAQHGFRATSAMEAFEKIIGGLQKNPDATIESIRGINEVTTQALPKAAPGGAKNNPAAPAATSGAEKKSFADWKNK
jgi:hypothetical protein